MERGSVNLPKSVQSGENSLQALRARHGEEAVAAAMASLGITEKELRPSEEGGLLAFTTGSVSSEGVNFRRTIAEKKRAQLLSELEQRLKTWTPNEFERWRLAVSKAREAPPSDWAAEKEAESQRKMEDFQNKQQKRMRHFIGELMSNKDRMDLAESRKLASEQRLKDFRKSKEEQVEIKRKELFKRQCKRQEGQEKAKELEKEFRNESAQKLDAKFSRSDECRQQLMETKSQIIQQRRVKSEGKDKKVEAMRQKLVNDGLERVRIQKEQEAVFAEKQQEMQAAREEDARQRNLKFMEKKRMVATNEAQKKAHREDVFFKGNDRLERARTAGEERRNQFQVDARKAMQKELARFEKNFEKVEAAQNARVTGIMEKAKHHIYSDGSYEIQPSDPALRRTYSDPGTSCSSEGRYSPMAWEVLQKENRERHFRQGEGHCRYLLEKTVAHRRRIDDFRKTREEAMKKRFAIDIQMKMAADEMRKTFSEIETKPPEKAQMMIRRIGKEYGIDDNADRKSSDVE